MSVTPLFQATEEPTAGGVIKGGDGCDFGVFSVTMTLFIYPGPKGSQERNKRDGTNETDDDFGYTRQAFKVTLKRRGG